MSDEPRVPEGEDCHSPVARRDAWSRYWVRGALHSCIGTYGERYGGSIAEFWKAVFEDLPAVARALDVATGNGVLARMLLEQCRSPGITCDAVDIATVHLPWLSGLPSAERDRVRLHSGADAARLPFEDRCFDLAMSQYGIEYTDLGATLPELLRVRRPNGVVAMVLHHAHGRPATLARIEIDHLGWLMRSGGWLEAMAAMVEPMARVATFAGRASLKHDGPANEARERFDAAQRELALRASGDGADILHEMRDAAVSLFTLAGREGAVTAANALEALREELVAGRTRLQDLCAHALDPGHAQALRERLEAALGVPVSLGELREEGGHLMGWALRSLRTR